jgi:hypothetical protein
MKQVVQETLNLEEYQCQGCRRSFYINGTNRSSLDLDFGCPYGCDDNGQHTGNIRAEVKKTVECEKKEGGEK